jgi:hypothetical protein
MVGAHIEQIVTHKSEHQVNHKGPQECSVTLAHNMQNWNILNYTVMFLEAVSKGHGYGQNVWSSELTESFIAEFKVYGIILTLLPEPFLFA